MKLNFSKIIPTGHNSTSCIEGTLDGHKLEVSRSMEGWTPVIQIKINDIIIHYAEPSESDKTEFHKLLNRAFAAEANAQDTARNVIFKSEAFKAIFID